MYLSFTISSSQQIRNKYLIASKWKETATLHYFHQAFPPPSFLPVLLFLLVLHYLIKKFGGGSMKHTGPHTLPSRIYFIVPLFFFGLQCWHILYTSTLIFPSKNPSFSFFHLFGLLLELGPNSAYKWQMNTTWNVLSSCHLYDQVSAAVSILLLFGIPSLAAFRSSFTFMLFEGLCFLSKPSLFLMLDHPLPLTHNLIQS